MVYCRLPSQSLYPPAWLSSECFIVFHHIELSSMSIIRQPYLSLTASSCTLERYVPSPTNYSSDCSCAGLHVSRDWVMVVSQILASGMFQTHGSFPLTFPHLESTT